MNKVNHWLDYVAGEHPPPYWAAAAQESSTTGFKRQAFIECAMHHRSKAFWMKVNGKWVRRHVT